MNILKICGIGIICLVALVCVRIFGENYARLIRTVSTVLFFGAMIALISPVISLLYELSEKSGIEEYAFIVIKALGIVFITHITSSLCRDCGEGGIASCVESVGKVEIVILALPIFREVLRVAEEMLSW